MTRRYWVPATALFLSSIMAVIGSVSQDAVAGIAALSRSTDASTVSAPECVPAMIRPAECFAHHPPRDVSARYWMRVIVFLVILLLILWLIYRSFTGWMPMIS